jgi:ketosteroid isomerase-like protein
MSRPNQTMIRTAYDAVATGDLQPMLNMLDADVQWHVSGDSPLAGDYEGKDGVLQFFYAIAEHYGNTFNLQVLDVLATDHHAVVLTNESGTIDGNPLHWNSAHVFRIADGVVVAFTSYQDDTYHAFWSTRALV